MKRIVASAGALLLAVVAALAIAIALGGPGAPEPMRSISEPFRKVDYSDQPPLETFLCRGGDPLAFREYKPASGDAAGTVVLIHGSSGHSSSMHAMGKALARAGYRAFAVDMLGQRRGPAHHRALFYAGQFKPLFASLGNRIPVAVVPGVDHIGLILDEKAIQAAIAAIRATSPAAPPG